MISEGFAAFSTAPVHSDSLELPVVICYNMVDRRMIIGI